MKVAATIVAIVCLAVAGTASGQTAIRAGEALPDELSPSDRTSSDGWRYDCFTLETREGALYSIDLLSREFDTLLAVGWHDCTGGENGDYERDDDGHGGTDSRIEIEGTGRTLHIRAQGFTVQDAGRYSLWVRDIPAFSSTARYLRPFIHSGRTVTGKLSRDDEGADAEYVFDCFQFDGQPDQRANFTLRSSDFHPRLTVYRGGRCEGDALASSDGSSGASEVSLEVNPPTGGRHSIKVWAGMAETGGYALSLGALQGR